MRHLTALSGLVVTLVGALAAVPSGTAFADPVTQPPAGKVGAEIVTLAGNACDTGSVKIAMRPDNTGFVLNHLPLIARVSRGTLDTNRQNCQVTVQLRGPKGYTYRIADVAAVGTAHLKSGANAVLRLSDSLPGAEPVTLLKRTFVGPLETPWDTASEPHTTTTPPDFVACGESPAVTLSIDLRATAGPTVASESIITLGYADLPRPDPGLQYRLDWRACPVAGV